MSVSRRWCLTLLYYFTTLAAALVVKDLGTLWYACFLFVVWSSASCI